MDQRTRKRFERMWRDGIGLAQIAATLGYSFSTLAKLRMIYGLEKRYGAEDDEAPPTPEVIRIRCLEQQTNWTPTERRMRWRGQPHTIYQDITGYGHEPQYKHLRGDDAVQPSGVYAAGARGSRAVR